MKYHWAIRENFNYPQPAENDKGGMLHVNSAFKRLKNTSFIRNSQDIFIFSK